MSALVVVELELINKSFHHITDTDFASSRLAQHGKHEGLKIWNGHGEKPFHRIRGHARVAVRIKKRRQQENPKLRPVCHVAVRPHHSVALANT